MRFLVFSMYISDGKSVGNIITYVRSQGRLKILAQSLHLSTSLIIGCADFRLRAIDRIASSSSSSSSESSLIGLFKRLTSVTLLSTDRTSPVLSEID